MTAGITKNLWHNLTNGAPSYVEVLVRGAKTVDFFFFSSPFLLAPPPPPSSPFALRESPGLY